MLMRTRAETELTEGSTSYREKSMLGPDSQGLLPGGSGNKGGGRSNLDQLGCRGKKGRFLVLDEMAELVNVMFDSGIVLCVSQAFMGIWRESQEELVHGGHDDAGQPGSAQRFLGRKTQCRF